MARSLRDELLKAGLVTSEQASRAERGSRPPAKPAKSKAAGRAQGNTQDRAQGNTQDRTQGNTQDRTQGNTQGNTQGKTQDRTRSRAARYASRREPRDSSKQRPPAPIPASTPVKPPSPDPEERVKQFNVEIRRILDTEAEKAEPESDTPFHFARGDRLKRLYVSEDQRRRLSDGGLAIVGFRGRHHLVPRRAGERVRELRPEVFVFVAAGADAVVEGYEGYEVPRRPGVVTGKVRRVLVCVIVACRAPPSPCRAAPSRPIPASAPPMSFRSSSVKWSTLDEMAP